jgi:hypothetical protein
MAKPMQPPTIDEVAAYSAEHNHNRVDAEAFIDHWITRGWIVRPGIRMQDWRAAVRTWQRNRVRWDAERSAAGMAPAAWSSADEAAINNYARQAAHIMRHNRGYRIGDLYAKVRDALGQPAVNEVRRRAALPEARER